MKKRTPILPNTTTVVSPLDTPLPPDIYSVKLPGNVTDKGSRRKDSRGRKPYPRDAEGNIIRPDGAVQQVSKKDPSRVFPKSAPVLPVRKRRSQTPLPLEALGADQLWQYDHVLHPKFAYQLCLLGATDLMLSRFFGVDPTVIEKWRREYPQFEKSIREGRDYAIANVAHSVYNRAVGYSYEEKEYTRVKVLEENPDYDPADPTSQSHIIQYKMELTKISKKSMAPDIAAAKYFLYNRTKRLASEEQWTNERQEITGKDGAALITSSIQQQSNDEKARETREAMLLAVKGEEQ